MSNIYIYFETQAERRDFVQNLLQLNYKVQNIGKPTEDTTFSPKEVLDLMEKGKTKSPYYNLYKQYNEDEILQTGEILSFCHPLEVFKNGFRNIYYLNSYMHRPGKWLVLQLRNTSDGENINNFITETVPLKNLGSAVSASEESTPAAKIDEISESLSYLEDCISQGIQIDEQKKEDTLNKIYKYLIELHNTDPQLFEGDSIFLWERSAILFFYENKMDKMENCFRYQSEFQPGSSDAFLNMGTFYQQKGHIDKAISAYKEGVQINPKDEFINFNLSFLYTKLGNTGSALNYAEKAIEANPKRELNYVLIGDIYFKNKDFEKAMKYYNLALQNVGRSTDSSIIIGCRDKIATCYLELVFKREGKVNL